MTVTGCGERGGWDGIAPITLTLRSLRSKNDLQSWI